MLNIQNIDRIRGYKQSELLLRSGWLQARRNIWRLPTKFCQILQPYSNQREYFAQPHRLDPHQVLKVTVALGLATE